MPRVILPSPVERATPRLGNNAVLEDLERRMANTFGLTRSLGGAIGAIALVSVLSSGAVLLTLDQQNEVIAARR